MNYNNCLIPSDVTGTGVWRLLWPAHLISTDRTIETSILRRPITDPNYYSGMNMIMVQRLVADYQQKLLEHVLAPAAQRYGIWLITNIDDCLHPDEIPEYNQGRAYYLAPTAVPNIQFMLDTMHMIIVTTDELRDYYHTKFNIPLNKIVKIPNYLPEWEFSNKYSSQRVMDTFAKNKKKPRIGIISSTSHYNQNKDLCVKDDLDLIINLIKSTTNIYQWVFVGSLPHKMQELQKSGAIEYYPGVGIYDYPNRIHSLDLNAIVAPLVDNTFNRCKSNIKILESSALGIPFFVQNLPNYSRYTEYTFNDENDLSIKLKHFFNLTKYDVRQICDTNFAKLSMPHAEGNGWWMRANYRAWESIFKIRQHTISLTIPEYREFFKSKNA